MIFDDFKNINLYSIDKEIIDFILNINSDISFGRHEINEKAYVNIDGYKTKSSFKLEAHKKHIDIQFLLSGAETVYITDKKDLIISEEYDDARDVEFYKTPSKKLNTLHLVKNKFLLLYPDDVHAPCVQYGEEGMDVKKAIVKIEI